MVQPPHLLLVTFPGQGHINPSLQLAKRLARMGVQVTFATSLSAINRINTSTASSLPPQGLSFGYFSDGYDDGFKPDVDDFQHFMSEMNRVGSRTLTEFILDKEKQGKRYSCIVYSILMTWVEDVGRDLNIPTTMLWNQNATMFDIYWFCFKGGYGDLIVETMNDPLLSLKIEGLPEMKRRDLPCFYDSSNPYSLVLSYFKEQMEVFDAKKFPRVLVNTFDELETEALKAPGSKLNLVGIGPLIPSAFLDKKDPSDKCFGGDLVNTTTDTNDYMEWLDSKAESSVIYVSFGSISELSRTQMEELADGLLKTGRPFLWVIRGKKTEDEEGGVSWLKELEEQGQIVTWCSQVEVLSHKSVGCFVTHCGWNSTFESITCGVPMVAFPQWADQSTNAKMVEDVWKIGVRADVDVDKGFVGRDEFRRCMELVMESEEMRVNAKKWMDLARKAVEEGGSSQINLQKFVDDISI